MRNFWSQVPLFRVAVAVIAGIGIEIFTDTILHLSYKGMLCAVLLLLVTFVFAGVYGFINKVSLLYRLRVSNGAAITVMLISLGYLLAWFYAEKNYQNHFQKFITPQSFVVAQVTKPPLEKEKTITLVAEVLEVRNNHNAVTAIGNILINLLRDTALPDLRYGDVIVFQSKIEEFNEPQNPDEFSYKLYQSFHNNYHRTFLKSAQWKLAAVGRGNILMAKVYSVREYFLSVIQRYVKDKNDFAVASAIMLGYNDYMNGDVTRAYSSSGALHVLSVSGLHVGIVFIMLNFLFAWMDKRGRKFQIAKAIGIIGFIWFYACLTGLSPSVLRSAMMFSMIQLGKVMVRNVNIYNVIFGSALLLIFFNPFIITEVGFRLSYLAVIGIIYIQPKISGLWIIGSAVQPKFKNQKWFLKPVTFLRYDVGWFLLSIIDFCRQIVAVSIAAQIATFPLSLYYFHQFPNLFLISNLIVIPVSNLILFCGTGLFAAGAVPIVNDLAGGIFSGLLSLLNKFIFFIDSFPFALIQGISITMAEMILAYILMLLLFRLTEVRSVKTIIISLLIISGLCIFQSFKTIQKSVQKKIIVYAASKQKAVAFISGEKVFTDFDETLINNQSAMLFYVKHHWWNCRIKKELPAKSIRLPFGKLILFENKKILMIDSTFEKSDFEIANKLKVDLVVLSHNPKIYLTQLKKLIEFDNIIFDGSNKKWRMGYWKKDCDKMKITYWSVAESGAYIQDISSATNEYAQLFNL